MSAATQHRDILAEICAEKRRHVAARKAARPLTSVEQAARQAPPPRGFIKALQTARSKGDYGFICEIKKASPSKGLIRPDFEPSALARAYQAGGASCLSVLTDEPYFQGADAYLGEAQEAADLPVLRKDFMVDPYQIVESRALGADCILLILAALEDHTAREMEARAHDLGMDVLIEVHDAPEMLRALEMRSPLVGINNRNLKTMTVSLDTTRTLAPMAPKDRILVAESGLATPADLAACSAVGADCFLIGETFMREADVAAAVKALHRKGPA
ncbi:indole-3-glycerol phosphate synthase TrpC [Yunchengibacter salinarum]|uniref:indole-3-glycerol phosphate synthase TrpC n=1 Tax=Yunchengibacter salinarum TaxID=3133399 RepID=UPI0035B58154